MKRIFLLFIILLSINVINCINNDDTNNQENEKSVSNNEITSNQKVHQNNIQDTNKTNLIQEQYWRTITESYSKIGHACIKLDYEKKSLNISYSIETKNNILKLKEDIKSYKADIEKTKLDMLKYYNGRPPEPFYTDLNNVEERYLKEYSQCLDSCNY